MPELLQQLDQLFDFSNVHSRNAPKESKAENLGRQAEAASRCAAARNGRLVAECAQPVMTPTAMSDR